MNATNVEYLRSNDINDIFRYINKVGEIDFAYFPRTMNMNINDVYNFLNK